MPGVVLRASQETGVDGPDPGGRAAMRAAEATSNEVATRTARTASSASRTGSGSTPQPFAAVLSASRDASRAAMNTLLPVQSNKSETGALAGTDAMQGRSKAQRKKQREVQAEKDSAARPARVDRLQEQMQKQQDSELGTAEDVGAARSSSTSNAVSVRPKSNAVDTSPASVSGRSDGSLGFTAVAPVLAPVSGVSPGPGPANGDAPAAGATLREVPAARVAPTDSGFAQQGGTSASSTSTAQGGSPGGASEDSESPSSSTTQGMARPGASVARTGGTSNEFQQLLGLLNRQRPVSGQRTEVTAPSTPSKGQPSAAKDIKEAVDIDSPGSVRELARLVRSRIGPRDSSMTIDLSPPELGRVRVDVRMQDGAVTVDFQAETFAGEEAIRGRLDDLRQSLEKQGVRIDHVQVEHLGTPQPSPDRDFTGQPQPEARQEQTAANYGHADGGGDDSRQSTGRETGQSTREQDLAPFWAMTQESPADGRSTGVNLLA